MRTGMCAATLAAIGLTVTGLATSAWAQNDGHLDGVWMSAELKAKVNLVDYEGGAPYPVERNVKARTPKDACYVALYWFGENSFEYLACGVCQDASGDWDFTDYTYFYEVADEDGSIANDWAELEFIAEGDDYDDSAELDTEGFLQLIPKIDKDGVVKKMTEVTSNQMAYRQIAAANTYGTGKGKLKLDVVDAAGVPAEAQSAFDACVEEED